MEIITITINYNQQVKPLMILSPITFTTGEEERDTKVTKQSKQSLKTKIHEAAENPRPAAEYTYALIMKVLTIYNVS